VELDQKIDKKRLIVRVPSEVASIDEAYEKLENGGTIEIGEGVFYVETKFDKSVVIKGSGMANTILESRTSTLPALHFSNAQREYKISNLTLRGIDQVRVGYPLLFVSGGNVDLYKVKITRSGHHGMAIIGGIVQVRSCIFAHNKWDGIAIFGMTSSAIISNSELLGNGDHGIDLWGGANAQIESSRSSSNSKSGIVVTGEKTQLTLKRVSSELNRECGIYLNHRSSLIAEQVRIDNNGYSGLVAQAIENVEWERSTSCSNGEFGYLIDRLSQTKVKGKLIGKDNKIGLILQKKLK
jgi:hypothetical protein